MSNAELREALASIGEAIATAAERLIEILGEFVESIRVAVREAGAPGEEATERDGFLSYKSETHAVAYAVGLGFALVQPNPWITVLVLGALLVNEGRRWRLDRRVFREIREEPQYFTPTLAISAIQTAWLYGVI